jgi:magnesium transporter
MLHEQLTPEIRQLIRLHRWPELSNRRLSWPEPETVAPDLVDELLELDRTDRVLFFRALPRPLASEVFAHLESDPEVRDDLLAALTDQETRHLLATLSPDDRTSLLEELPGQVIQRLLNFLNPQDLAEARQLLGYPEESVGRLMTPDYIAVKPEWSVSRALEHIRRRGRASETVDVIYVHDDAWRLIDALPLKRFILADPEAPVQSIMDNAFISLSAYDDRESALRTFQRYDAVALPVVDSQGILIGIVTVDDILDVAEAEFTEDFQKFAAMEPVKEAYWQTSILRFYRSRVGWLAALVLVCQ